MLLRFGSSRVPVCAPILLIFAFLFDRSASGQQVEYALRPGGALFDAAYYAGEAADGSDVAGRMPIGTAAFSNDGKTLAVMTINRANLMMSLFLVDAGNPSSWRRLTPDRPFFADLFLTWTSDDSAILWAGSRIPVDTGQYISYTLFGETITKVSLTRLPEDNWAASTYDLEKTVTLYPILPNGLQDNTRSPVIICNIADIVEVDEPTISADGTAVMFVEEIDQPLPGPDDSNMYLIKNLQSIIHAAKLPGTDQSALAPTSTADSNVVAIRTTESINYVHVPLISEDGRLALYGEEWNRAFNDNNFFNTLALSDWDFMVSNADGSGDDFRLALAGNQAPGGLSAGGLRMSYFSSVSGVLNAFLTSLEVRATIPGDAEGDNDIRTTAPISIGDGSRTFLTISAGTLIDFPAGEPPIITITTPFDPVLDAELPPNASVLAIPVVRQMGPSGATFDPPLELTMSYTDAEVRGLIELALQPYLYNEITGRFDIRVLPNDILERDMFENTIRFRVFHFSEFGLAAPILQNSAASWREYN